MDTIIIHRSLFAEHNVLLNSTSLKTEHGRQFNNELIIFVLVNLLSTH